MTGLSVLGFSWSTLFPYPLFQIPGLILVIGLIIFWVMYRRRQM